MNFYNKKNLIFIIIIIFCLNNLIKKYKFNNKEDQSNNI